MLTVSPDFAGFEEAARRGNFVPVYAERLADLTTPVAAMQRLSSARRAFLLESAEGGEHVGRYSYLGADPFLEVTGDAAGLRLRRADGAIEEIEGDPVARLAEIQGSFEPVDLPGLPPFSGGAVGYVGYDAIRWVERIPASNPADPDLPWLVLGFYDTVVAFDHLRHRMLLIAHARIDDPHDRAALRAAYARAVERLEALSDRLRAVADEPAPLDTIDLRGVTPLPTTTNLGAREYAAAVATAQDHIVAGDAFQIVLSRRLTCETAADPLTAYRALRAINPSPYMFCLDVGSANVVGASPEMLVRVEGHRVETRPIAGTRRRDADPAIDRALERELLADEKERAEHLMLVDLGRNDVGRVAEFGSVEVPQFMEAERYSHVMHIVSSVHGRLRPEIGPIEALFACFPAGTVSGAPKIRAMEIIDELENVARGPYAGAVLYSDFAGNMNSCITIRTIVMEGGRAHVQAGAGIVADSVPEREFVETNEKAAAAIQALSWADAAVRSTATEAELGDDAANAAMRDAEADAAVGDEARR